MDDAAGDEALARRIASADRSAEAELCTRLYPRIRAYGLRHLRDAACAADLAQQVLVVMIEALRAGRVVELDRIAAFAMGVSRNIVRDWRSGEARRSTLLETFGPSMAAVVDTEVGLGRARLDDCLRALPARERLVVALTFVADCDGDDIARELATTIGNVRVVRHRALRQLHDCMTRGAP